MTPEEAEVEVRALFASLRDRGIEVVPHWDDQLLIRRVGMHPLDRADPTWQVSLSYDLKGASWRSR